MSTNVAYNPSGSGRHYTVAELVARERAAAVRARATQRAPEPTPERTQRLAPVGTRAGEAPDQEGMHVTELLRREGVEYEESITTAPPALAAKTSKDRSRAAMISRAAVLFGLTVGGMVGLQTTVANTPEEAPGPVDSGGIIAAPQEIDQHTSTSEATQQAAQETTQNNEQEPAGGGASPTTAADVTLHDDAGPLSEPAPQNSTGGTGSVHTTGGTADTGASAPRTTQAPAPSSSSTQRASSGSQNAQQDDTSTQREQSSPQETQQQQRPQPEEDDPSGGDDGGALGRVLDPVTGVVNGVLDTGAGLLGG